MEKTNEAQHFSEEIFNKLYPLIEREMEHINNSTDWQNDCGLSDAMEELRREFQSLSYYEKKLVFPSLLSQPPNGRNILEIERLVSLKERRIMQLAMHVENLANNCGLPEKHPIFGLVFLFQNSFNEVKGKWQGYLKSLSNQAKPSGEKRGAEVL